jgi:chromosome segregation ATPase
MVKRGSILRRGKNRLDLPSLSLLFLSPFFSSLCHAQPLQEINLDELRKEIQSARGSASAIGDGTDTQEADLEKRRKELLAAESALLKELQNPEPLKVKKPSQIPDLVLEKTADMEVNHEKLPALRNEAQVVNESFSTETLSAEKDNYQKKVEPLKVYAEPIKKIPLTSEDYQYEISKIEEIEVTPPKKVAAARSNPSKLSQPKRGEEFDTLKAATSAIEANIKRLKDENDTLKSDALSAKDRSERLFSELNDARDRLMIAEAEVERLSGLMKTRNVQTLSALGMASSSIAKTGSNAASNQKIFNGGEPIKVAPSQPVVKAVKQEKQLEDILIGTVVVDKANLRSGPGKDNSPVMTVSKGTRLTIETRHGEWYRIVTPTGTRAWVASEVLAFGPTNTSSPTKTVRIKGYSSQLENG